MKLALFFFTIACLHVAVRAQENTTNAFAERVALGIPSALTNSTESIANYFNEKLTTPEQKLRAAYAWVATNIQYDASHLHRVILDEDKAEKVTWALQRKKGVCENFSAIFTDLCLKSGIRSYTVEGYTKNGGTDRSGHAWSAAYINNDWYLFDPTWDAGYLHRNGSSAGLPQYYKQTPREFISDHLPFDPMFQFLNQPITYREFYGGARGKSEDEFFNYKDSIDAYEKMEPLNRYISAAARIEKNGSSSSLTTARLAQLKMEREIIYQDNDVELYNQAVEDYKTAVNSFKNYLAYRNDEFQPAEPLERTRSKLTGIAATINGAIKKLEAVKQSKAVLQLNTEDILTMLTDLGAKVAVEKNYLEQYFARKESQ